MKKILLLFALVPTIGFCALSPLSQSIREIESILIYPALDEHLAKSSKINDIKRVDGGYLIVTETHVLKVTIKYDEKKRIGAKKFTLHFGNLMPLHHCN